MSSYLSLEQTGNRQFSLKWSSSFLFISFFKTDLRKFQYCFSFYSVKLIYSIPPYPTHPYASAYLYFSSFSSENKFIVFEKVPSLAMPTSAHIF